MSNITTRLKALAAFDESAAELEGKRQITYPSDFVLGAEWQHARLRPLVEALIECADTLDRYTADYSKHHCECGNCWTCEFRRALARLKEIAGEE